MGSAFRTPSHCAVCGCADVYTDEVVDRDVVLLAECPRCEHRWTVSAPPQADRTGYDPECAAGRRSALVHREVAAAA